MDGFLGIDIGTTNSKALLLTEEGRILELWTQETPYKIIGGRQYMDIRRIEEFTDQWIDTAGKLCRLKSVSYSSIGESVIPVKDGKAMAFPLAWYEDVPMLVQDTKAYTGFEYTGVHDSNTFSFYKIMWMEKNILSEPPDYWLPVCSYFIYRKTGNACWDTSQAGRSYMYDIHNKAWIREVTERYGIQVPERIGLIGEGCGEKDGITYSLGGHDHYVGLFAVYQLSGGKELFYDSMGSSSVLAAVMDDSSRRLRGKATYDPKGGCLVTGFKKDEYVVNRSMDYYGRILHCIKSWRSNEKTGSFYDRRNREIGSPEKNRLCLFACSKGYGRYSEHAMGINLMEIKDDTELNDLIFSAYLYLSLGSGNMYKELSRFSTVSPKNMPYFAGGGITQNRLFMKLKATVLDREITVLNTTELSALGAAVSGVCACGRNEILKETGEKLLYGDTILPEPEYSEIADYMRKRYESG